MWILAAGGVLVAALIVWALTRTVEPASVMSTETTPVADASTAAPTSTTQTAGFTTTASTTPTPTGTTPNVQVSTQPTPQAPPAVDGNKAEVRRIAVEDLRAQHNRGAVTVIDVRDAASFATGHIPGAINMPFASIQGMTDAIPKGKPIVTYCT